MSNARLLPCSCGRKVPVRPSQAGQTVRCECGRELQVPTWREIAALELAQPESPAQRVSVWGWPEALLLSGVATLVVVVLLFAYLLLTRPIQPTVADLRHRVDRLSAAEVRRVWHTYLNWSLDPWAEDPGWERAQARFRAAMGGTAVLAFVAFFLVVLGYRMRNSRQRQSS